MQIYNFTGKALEEDKLNIDSIEKFLDDAYNKWSTSDMLSSGKYRCMGWEYDFREHLNRYLVKQYHAWNEYYCINKTTLRNSIFGTINEIVEIKNKHKK